MLSPLEAVGHPDPYPYYASLVAERPLYFDESLQLWVASQAEVVAAILGDPGCRVRPSSEPVPRGIDGSPAGEVFGSLVRMTDGDVQQRLKRIVVAALGQVEHEVVATVSAQRARRALARAKAVPFDELMFAIPAQVVAFLCGLDEGAADAAVPLIGEFVQCIPASANAAQQTAAARSASRLQEMMGPLLTERTDGLLGALVRAAGRADWHETAPLLANGIGFLSQTYDATAGLIGNTLIALSRGAVQDRWSATDLERIVLEVARHDAPVQNTRRFAAVPFRHGAAQVETGQAILLLLAAANRDPVVNANPHEFRMDRAGPVLFTFGTAAHRCPGEILAVTIATAVLSELLVTGFDPADLPTEVAYRPSANARIPILPSE